MERAISLQELMSIIKKRCVLILSIITVAIGIAIVISFYVLTPVYEAQTQLLVNQKVTDEDYFWTQMETDLQLINTYNVILTSPIILQQVIEKLDLRMTEQQLKQKIFVSNESNSKVVQITVQDENRQQVATIANTLSEIFQQEIPRLMQVDNITILSSAIEDEQAIPIKPNKELNVTIAALVGMVLGLLISFLLEIIDKTVKTERDVEELLELPVMGLVTSITPEKRRKSRKTRGRKRVWFEKERSNSGT